MLFSFIITLDSTKENILLSILIKKKPQDLIVFLITRKKWDRSIPQTFDEQLHRSSPILSVMYIIKHDSYQCMHHYHPPQDVSILWKRLQSTKVSLSRNFLKKSTQKINLNSLKTTGNSSKFLMDQTVELENLRECQMRKKEYSPRNIKKKVFSK